MLTTKYMGKRTIALLWNRDEIKMRAKYGIGFLEIKNLTDNTKKSIAKTCLSADK